MKKVCFIILVAVFLNSCSDDPQPSIDQLVLEDIRARSYVLPEALALTSQIVSELDLRTLVATSDSRDDFITKMRELTINAVLEVSERHGVDPSVMEWDASPSTIQNNLKQVDTYSGALNLLSNEIDFKLGSLPDDIIILIQDYDPRKGRELDITSFGYNGGSRASSQIKTFSCTSDVAMDAKQGADNIYLKINSWDGLIKPINDFIRENPDTEVLLTMLLPAFTKPQNSYTALTNIIFGTQDSPGRKTFDLQASRAALLGAGEKLVSIDSRPEDVDHATFPLQAAMHDAICVMLWAEIYDKYKN